MTSTVLNRESLFGDWQAGRLLVREMRAAHGNGWIDSLAWVVMPDHLHWLFSLQAESLDRVMQRVKSRSAIAVNGHLGRAGSLWQPGFHDHALRREEDLREAGRYIVANPLRAGLVRDIGDYPLWDAVWI